MNFDYVCVRAVFMRPITFTTQIEHVLLIFLEFTEFIGTTHFCSSAFFPLTFPFHAIIEIIIVLAYLILFIRNFFLCSDHQENHEKGMEIERKSVEFLQNFPFGKIHKENFQKKKIVSNNLRPFSNLFSIVNAFAAP